MAESSVPPDSAVYAEGVWLAVVVLVLVFVFVAWSDNEWFVGMGLVAVLVSMLFIFVVWQELADYPLRFREGDRPRTDTDATGRYEKWDLGPGAGVNTTFDVDGAVDATSLTDYFYLDPGCPAARVDWRVYVDDALVGSGTLREDRDRDLTEVTVPSGHQRSAVRFTATRRDSADCTTTLLWYNPGLEGPGHGRFRFFFPLPSSVE